VIRETGERSSVDRFGVRSNELDLAFDPVGARLDAASRGLAQDLPLLPFDRIREGGAVVEPVRVEENVQQLQAS